MGIVNIPQGERNALRGIDTDLLGKLIDRCFLEESTKVLCALNLDSCGSYVASRFRFFEKALAEYSNAKSAKKRDEAKYDAYRASSDLVSAVQQMKSRVETEENEEQLFYIDDQIAPPCSFNERMTVRVSYKWRQNVKDEWIYGSIVFSHDANMRADYTLSQPKRRPSAAKQERDRQEKLYREWERLMSLGLHSVRDYFREGGNGAAIPKIFYVIADPYTQLLNNFSAKFWIDRSGHNVK